MYVIKAKFTDSEGNEKGRAYTYGSNSPLAQGDIIEISPGKRGIVTEVGINPEELLKFGDGAKFIIGLWDDREIITDGDGVVIEPDRVEIVEEAAESGQAEIMVFGEIDIDENLIIIEQLPVLTERLRMVKEQVEKAVEEVKSLVITEGNKTAIKKIRADLRKQLEFAEGLRKAIKTAILAPYLEVEKEFQECITNALNDADAFLKSKIYEIENALKDEKANNVKMYFIELVAFHCLDFVKFEDTGIKIGLSDTETGLKKQLKIWVENVKRAIDAIDDLDDEIREEVRLEFKKSFDFAGAMRIVSERKRDLETQKMVEVERKRLAELMAEKEAAVNAVVEQEKISIPPQTVRAIVMNELSDADKLIRITGTFVMKRGQKEAFKAYLEENNIKYEKLEG